MTKTQEELNQIKNEFQSLATKFKELTEDELAQIAGGEVASIKDWFYKIGESEKKFTR